MDACMGGCLASGRVDGCMDGSIDVASCMTYHAGAARPLNPTWIVRRIVAGLEHEVKHVRVGRAVELEIAGDALRGVDDRHVAQALAGVQALLPQRLQGRKANIVLHQTIRTCQSRRQVRGCRGRCHEGDQGGRPPHHDYPLCWQ
eukprot:363648-Chlamydomonas_euryale.AAC.6